MIRIAIVLLLWLAASPATAGDEMTSAQEVLDRFIDAVGGRDALTSRDLRHYRGTIVQDLSWTDPQRTEVPFFAEADAEGVVRYGEVETWADLPDTGATELRSKLRWIMHPRFALVVEEFFPELSLRGFEMRAGRPVVVLVPRDLQFEYYALYFDVGTGLLSHIGYHNDLEDWRDDDGVLYPHRWVFGRKGGHTTYVFEETGSGAGR